MARMRSRSNAPLPSTLSSGTAQRVGLVHARVGIDGADARSTSFEFLGRHQIGLVEQDHVGEGDLVLGLGRVLEAQPQMLGVDDRDDRVELGLGRDVVVHEEGLRHRRRVGEAGGLDEDGVEAAAALHQALDDADQVAAHRAADAAVVHLEHFLVGARRSRSLSMPISPNSLTMTAYFLPCVLGEDAVQQRGLAGAEIAGEHGDGDFFGHAGTPCRRDIGTLSPCGRGWRGPEARAG